jgi:hypothetical protein
MSTWVVAMVHQMSGGRYDDRQWPPPGFEFEVPDWEGEGLVRSNSAVKIRELKDDRPAYVTPPAPVSLPSETAAGPVPPEPAPEVVVSSGPAASDSDSDVQEPPKPSDPKQDWMDYAVAESERRGAPITEDQAGARSKADLMSEYGGRL